jgi:hypothetical protein
MSEEKTTFADSFHTTLNEYTKSLVSSIVLPPIVDFLKQEKEIEITIEELEQALDVQTATLVAPIIRSGTRRKKKPRNNVSVEKPKEGEGCVYLYVRGKKRGKYCNQDCADESLFCKEHKNSSVVKNAKKIEQIKTKKTKTTKDPKKDEVGIQKETPKINVGVYKINDSIIQGYFIQDETAFIIQDTPDSLYVIAKEEEDKTHRLLTKEEQSEAKKYFLKVYESKKDAKKALEDFQEIIRSITEETNLEDNSEEEEVKEEEDVHLQA